MQAVCSDSIFSLRNALNSGESSNSQQQKVTEFHYLYNLLE